MTTVRANAYRRKLNRLAAELSRAVGHCREEALRPIGAEPDDRSDAPVHPADPAADASGLEGETAVLENEGHLLGEVNAALGRIEAGTFGRCEACGKAISQKRLDAAPYARRCIRCARVSEAAPPA